jgi:hypothetical protein
MDTARQRASPGGTSVESIETVPTQLPTSSIVFAPEEESEEQPKALLGGRLEITGRETKTLLGTYGAVIWAMSSPMNEKFDFGNSA